MEQRVTVTGGGVPSSARGQRRPLLPPFRPPRPPARTSHAIAEEHSESQIDESQPLLTPEVPVAEVVNTGRRVVQSQLTASTGLDDEVPSDNSDDDDVDADDDENNGNNLADWFATTRSNNAGGVAMSTKMIWEQVSRRRAGMKCMDSRVGTSSS